MRLEKFKLQLKSGQEPGQAPSYDSAFKSIAKSKWDCVLPIVRRILQEINSTLDGKLEFKQLERDRGFLLHIVMAYKKMINPYLKGLHSIDSWRPNREEDGWKMKAKVYLPSKMMK